MNSIASRALSVLGLAVLSLSAVSAPASAAPSAVRAPGATLVSASFSIHMDVDQKDRDTTVTVTVRDVFGTTAARVSSTYGKWDQYSDQGPFQIPVLNHPAYENVRGATATLRIDPHGNNHIEPNFYVDLLFSDNTHLSADCPQLDLDQESRQISCGIG
ncbi:hypothetical protein P3T37_000129 [Kitasatospora sp. MAA4]|uniref:hypothetical protein n=1 Tax=Kitasatospora sp. MAA4 TaxID=3035093 RepID=UPI0024761E69|nr:hypothetical protein [Kitasatospora sp. MAA4]MDH6130762.1 hypothetical protein [Kitasatospora sp. MAA4]